jgi:general stress protein CsbA
MLSVLTIIEAVLFPIICVALCALVTWEKV